MRFGITERFKCGYLPDEEEQLIVLMDDFPDVSLHYGQLIQLGFRRSGDQIYRPHCPACNACKSVRIPVELFTPSRSQKRVLNKAKHFERKVNTGDPQSYYSMYERYIEQRHQEGAMYPPSMNQFAQFVQCQWKSPIFIEAWDGKKCIAVAVTDTIDDGESHSGLSALYTFFEPDYENYSIGTWMILQQISLAKELGMPFLYLGYHVSECQKMAYKRNFYPHEVFDGAKWTRFDKKSDC